VNTEPSRTVALLRDISWARVPTRIVGDVLSGPWAWPRVVLVIKRFDDARQHCSRAP